jgi:hypothetical protein
VKRRVTPLLALAIFALNVWLNGPLFIRGELPFRGSIEGGYVSMARFIANHPNPWSWNPLQYSGLPTQFMYVPGLSYLTALGAWITQMPVDYVYRLLTATFACLGPVTVFFFALYFTKSRWWALAAALGYSFLSPSYGLFPAVEKDRGIVQLPWRIQVLAKYGEGPHNTGLTILPMALLALWLAATRRTYARILVAAVLLAAIPLTNWVAAFGLAIACLALLLAAFGEPDFRYVRAFAAAGLAYALACFWLTPSFVHTIAFNWPVDSFGYQLLSTQKLLVIGLFAGALAVRAAFYFLGGSFYFRFTVIAAFAFCWITTSWYIFGVDTIPESRRYAIEFELFLALAVAEALRLTWKHPNDTVRLCARCCAGLLLLAGTPQLYAYVTQGWKVWTPVPREQTVEFQLAQWIARHRPDGRVFASGGLRFRLNSWYDLPQVGGGFETGLTNRTPYELAYRVRAGTGLRPGHEAEDTVRFLKALDAQYVVINGPTSKEYYRDFKHPERMTDLRIVYREGGDIIYALPYRPMATVIQAAELPAGDPTVDPETLAPYVAAIDDDSRPQLLVRWTGPASLNIDGRIPPDRLVSVRENAAPGWSAKENNLPIPITPDKLGYMVLHPVGGDLSHIELRYNGTAEQRIMAAVCALAWIAAIAALFRKGLPWRKSLASTTTN